MNLYWGKLLDRDRRRGHGGGVTVPVGTMGDTSGGTGSVSFVKAGRGYFRCHPTRSIDKDGRFRCRDCYRKWRRCI
jgi:hypothetical protein